MAKPINFKHGMRHTPEYNAWKNMIRRCYKPDCKDYINYGGRGIAVCDRWLNDFLSFYQDMGTRPSDEYSLDRKDVNGNYVPDNCKWSTRSEQVINRRVQKNNTSGVRGVSFHKHSRKWYAEIAFNGDKIYIGSYNDLSEAAEARRLAEIQYFGAAL